MPQEVRLMIRRNAADMHCGWHGYLCQTQDLSPMSTQEAKFGKPEGSALTRSWLPSSIFSCIDDPVVSGIN
jgi:hypothetical protein